jgi:intein-encoded DNA endonuclease-like protein
MSKRIIKNFTEDQSNQIVAWYLEGKSANWIGKQFDVSHTVITKRVGTLGIKRSREEAFKVSKLECNHSYFKNIDSEDKAYWLGFLFADGNVTDNKQPSLQVCLAESDTAHLEAFNNTLNSSYNVGHYNYKNPVCQLRIPSKELVEDLTTLGCGPRKTFDLKPPSEEKVPSELVRHFIRGYFDGDGCKSGSHLVFLGTEELLNWISKVLPIDHSAKVYKPNGKNIYRLDLSLGSELRDKAIYEYLYTDASIWLERKRVKFSHALT